MSIDAGELWSFYDRPLGHNVRRLLGMRIRSRWRHIEGETLFGLGYASPLMGSFRGEARRIGSMMPAQQGAVVWPHAGDSMTVLVEPDNLPLPDGSVDRLIVVHCLEHAERVDEVLREIWRVMAPEGHALFIVPNRGGIWARVDSTPFGQGRPYTRRQLEGLLRQAMLTPIDFAGALRMPPVERKLFLRSAVAFERIGARIVPGFAGVMMLEARKELLRPTPKGTPATSLSDLVRLPSRARPAASGSTNHDTSRSQSKFGKTQSSR